jgi:hypothetical protein
LKDHQGDHQVTIIGGKDTISQEDFVAYWDILHNAFTIHVDRERIRKGLWKEYPASDQAKQVKVKIDRVLRSLSQLPPGEAGSLTEEGHELRLNALEELYDIINYAVFTARRLEGTWQM